MKAALFYEHGGPEKMRVEEISDPVAGPGEVVVNVKAAALNRLDLRVLFGSASFPVSRPHIVGSDAAGEVASAGPSVTGFAVGDRVVVAPGLGCGECKDCTAGAENRCPSFSVIGAKAWGTFAEKIRVPARQLLRLPRQISFEEAAAFPVAYLTAWHMLVTRAQLQAGQAVLVAGASGGVGSAAVQIAKLLGTRVLATVSQDEKVAAVRALGADAVVDSTQQAIAHVARAFTQKRGVDVVFEHVGPATWKHTFGSLRPGGTLVICGATSGPTVELEIGYLASREITVLGSRLGTMGELRELMRHFESRALRPVIGARFSLEQAAKALQHMADRKHVGKIVLTIA